LQPQQPPQQQHVPGSTHSSYRALSPRAVAASTVKVAAIPLPLKVWPPAQIMLAITAAAGCAAAANSVICQQPPEQLGLTAAASPVLCDAMPPGDNTIAPRHLTLAGNAPMSPMLLSTPAGYNGYMMQTGHTAVLPAAGSLPLPQGTQQLLQEQVKLKDTFVHDNGCHQLSARGDVTRAPATDGRRCMSARATSSLRLTLHNITPRSARPISAASSSSSCHHRSIPSRQVHLSHNRAACNSRQAAAEIGTEASRASCPFLLVQRCGSPPLTCPKAAAAKAVYHGKSNRHGNNSAAPTNEHDAAAALVARHEVPQLDLSFL
jgi:hypothetical protein